MTFSAKRTSSSVGAPNERPPSAARCTARRPRDARGRGWPGPTIRRSRRTRVPSAPKTFAPSAREMKTGSPPTARNARTGLFTPPGMTFSARSKREADLGSLMEGGV